MMCQGADAFSSLRHNKCRPHRGCNEAETEEEGAETEDTWPGNMKTEMSIYMNLLEQYNLKDP